MLSTGAVTGFVPVSVYFIPVPLAGVFTVIVPVGVAQVGCTGVKVGTAGKAKIVISSTAVPVPVKFTPGTSA
ncbi:hypothetical protein GIY83_16635 [Flavobacterium sp. SLB02]|nr:hypothetical protein GIY83_16635 [Flavobacterium sp. SLB02]